MSRLPGGNGQTDLDAVEEPGSLEAIKLSLDEARDIEAVPDDLVPSLSEVSDDRPAIYSNDCHLEFDDVEIPDHCVFGDTDSDTTVVLFGDSHAAQWYPALEPIAEKRGWRLLPWTKSACAPVDVSVIDERTSGTYQECDEWRETVFDRLDDMSPDMVIVGAADATTIVDARSESSIDEWAEGWTRTLDRLADATDNTVVIGDTPRTATDNQSAPECISLHLYSVQTCNEEQPYALSHLDRRDAALERQREAEAEVIDPTAWVCLDDFCPVVVEDVLVYRDRHHLSTPYAKSLATVLDEALPEA